MKRRFNLTLGQVFLLSLLSLMILLAVLFTILLNGSRNSILQSSDRLRIEVGKGLRNQVVAFRDQATGVADDVEREFQHGLIDVNNRDALESALYAKVLNYPDISEVTFTHADATGNDGTTLLFAPGDRWQVSVYRGDAIDNPGAILARRVSQDRNNYFADIRRRDSAGSAPVQHAPATDPTTHSTFEVVTLRRFLHRPVWTDLHYSELSTKEDRVEVTVQKAVFSGDTFLGVVRVGLLESQLNQIVAASNNGGDTGITDVRHTCFLCDNSGRLITPVTPSDTLGLDQDDLRIHSPAMPPQIARALASPVLANLDDQIAGDTVTAAGKKYLVTYLPLSGTQDWVLGVIGSQEDYLGGLLATQRELLMAAVIVMAAILFGGAMTLRTVQRGLSRVIAATSQMREFDFAARVPMAPFRDVQEVMESLEQAKTAMRAMGKYVPIDLVRDLYHMNREPALGGELRELSIMFTDIQKFTDLSETLSPDVLAVALGNYLVAMTGAIHMEHGTIDKYIGDSVMAIWNAPALCPDHAHRACASALACREATAGVNASPAWHGLPPLVTRCGLHCDRVMVGHFGAPDRMSYTALGDGVNLASRLEGLNKQYGTTLLVSEMIRQQVGDAFQFRLLDRVAVKGKTHAVKVYELLGAAQDRACRTAAVTEYESALQAYWNRDFAGAIAMLSRYPSDPPSVIMAERCRKLIDDPPGDNWDGVYISMMK